MHKYILNGSFIKVSNYIIKLFYCFIEFFCERKALEISSHLQMFELCIACLGYTKAKYILWEVRRAASAVVSPIVAWYSLRKWGDLWYSNRVPFVVLCGIVGHVCQTQDWFIIMWKIWSVLEMKDGKDPLKASQYCTSLLALSSFYIALSPHSDSGGGAPSTRLCCVVRNFWWLWAARPSAPLPS